MDLRKELLAILNNPSTVWQSIASNLSSEARLALLVFSTMSTPSSLPDWQAAIARIDTDAAAQFDRSLRVIDDVFIKSERRADGVLRAEYRNPSMDDFCADFLDRNAGIASAIASNSPSLSQALRMIDLGLARRHGVGKSMAARYENLRELLVKRPGWAIDRLITALQDEPSRTNAAKLIGYLLDIYVSSNHTNLTPPHKQLLVQYFRRESPFDSKGWPSGPLDRVEVIATTNLRLRALPLVFESKWADFYDLLCNSATTVSDFYTIMRVDKAHEVQVDQIRWATAFEDSLNQWSPPDGSLEDLAAAKERFDELVEFVSLDAFNYESEWDDAFESARDEAEPDEDDLKWLREYGSEAEAPESEALTQEGFIDSMFNGLLER